MAGYIGTKAVLLSTTAADVTGDAEIGGDLTVSGNLSVDGGTIKLDGNYPVGANNVALGDAALDSNVSGASNTAIGADALTANTASNNTAVGYQAGYLVTTGSKNTIIGSYNGNQNGLDIRTSSNHIVLSDGDGTPRGWFTASGSFLVPTVYSITTGSAANVFVGSNGHIHRSTSSARYKNTVEDATHGLTELMTLRPVTYKGNNDGDTVFGGLIAEEVHDAGLTEFVQYNDDGEPDALAYGNMVSLCIKAIQEQQATITALEARITALEAN